MADKDLFYGIEDANTTIRCKDGDLKINERMLPKRLRFNGSPDAEVVELLDYDITTFKTFLDVLMGFEELDREKALLIFPVAMQRDIHDLVEKCILKLQPTEMDENVVRTLNMATFFSSEELTDIVLNFLLQYGINKLFIEAKYFSLLEPKSMAALLRMAASRNMIILQSVYYWGKMYIESHFLDVDLRTFLKKHYILQKLSIDCLERADSVFQFYNNEDDRMNMFTEKEILNYLKKVMVSDQPTYLWSNILAGKNLREHFALKNKMYIDSSVNIKIKFNATVCNVLLKSNEDCYFEVTISLLMQGVSKNHALAKGTSYKIFSAENNGSTKAEISTTIFKPSEATNLFSEIIIFYKFYRECKILKTEGDWLPSIFNVNKQSLLFTCGIDFV